MSFDSLLRHTVTIKRRVGVLDGLSEQTYDAGGQPITALTELATVPARITPKAEREVAELHQAGPVVSDHTIFMRPTDLQSGDQLVAADGTAYEVMTIRDAAGHGHHLEVAARLVHSDELTWA